MRIPRAWGRRAPSKPANEVTPDFVGLLSQKPNSPAGRVSACKPYRELIEEQLSRGRNAKAIWHDLVTDHGYLQHVCRVVMAAQNGPRWLRTRRSGVRISQAAHSTK